LFFGGGPALIDSAGVPWTAAYIDSRSEPTADLRSNIAAEARAKIVYERLINITDDPGIKEALGFLMTREIAHQKSFEKALYAIEDNFPSGKLPGVEKYANLYVNTSQGEGDTTGPWNSGDQWDRIDDLSQTMPIDGGDGLATVGLDQDDQAVATKLAKRTMSDPASDPLTGADLGAGPGADQAGNLRRSLHVREAEAFFMRRLQEQIGACQRLLDLLARRIDDEIDARLESELRDPRLEKFQIARIPHLTEDGVLHTGVALAH
jgi:Mn-containing catalase